MTSPAIALSGVTKRFGALTVLRSVDLDIAAGRATAIVGPNAAGKSTLIRAVLGLTRPDAGRISVEGVALNGHWDYRRRIGYMPQAACFPENLSGREVIAMLRDLRGRGTPTDEELVASFGLASELDKKVRTLSGGTRQKLNAVIALLFRPSILILDEPTAGLDPVAAGILKEKILRLRNAGVSVVLTSHVMSDLEELADDIVVLLEGRVEYQGAISDLARLTGLAGLEKAIASLMLHGRSGA